MDAPFAFGPWPKGMNTVNPDPELKKNELRIAVNVDITDRGTLRRRGGAARVYQATNCHSAGPKMLFVTESTMKRYDPDTNSVVTVRTGLSPQARVCYVEVNDDIYWSNGVESGIIDNATFTNRPWGLEVPNSPVLAAATGGTLDAGIYQVVCGFRKASGEQSGLGLAATVTAVANDAIAITAIPQPTSGQGVTTVDVYVSQANGQEVYYHGTVPVGTLTYAILNTSTTTRTGRFQFMTKPPAANLLAFRRGRIYGASVNTVWFTEPLAYGLHDPVRNFWTFENPVMVMAEVDNGMWIVIQDHTYFISGDNPHDIKLNQQADFSAPMQNALHIPKSNDIAWLSHRGWCQGTNDGNIKLLSGDRVQINETSEWAPTMYRQHNGIRQFVGLTRGSPVVPANSSDFETALDGA